MIDISWEDSHVQWKVYVGASSSEERVTRSDNRHDNVKFVPLEGNTPTKAHHQHEGA
jgi:hypothetical protein